VAAAGRPASIFNAGFEDGTVRLWQVATGREGCQIQGHRAGIPTVAFSPDSNRLSSAGEDGTGLLWGLTSLPRVESLLASKDLAPEVLETLWAALTGEDAARAYRALWGLAVVPKQAVPLLETRLRVAAVHKTQEIARLIADLDSDDFAAREKA